MAYRQTIFLCSTINDLSSERAKVLEAIRRLQLSHDSMEFFGARPRTPLDTCLEEVRKSDVVVVIVGHRYGTLVEDLRISFSEAEYNEAQKLGIPCLVYIRDENEPVPKRSIEDDPQKIVLLENWKKTLASRHTISTFRNADELAVYVAADLGRIIHSLEESSPRNRQIEAFKKEKLEAIASLSAGIAHAFNNPLTVISGLARIARTKNSPSDIAYLHNTLTLIEEQCFHASDILRRLRDFTKKLKEEEETIQLDALIKSVVNTAIKEANIENTEVKLSLSKEQILVKAVRSELEIVLLNVIINGLQSMRESGGVLEITTKKEKNKVLISFHDEGVGIPEEMLKNIFDPFFTTKSNGTGLGLFVANRIIAKICGQIWAESRSPRGTSFFIRLPKAG